MVNFRILYYRLNTCNRCKFEINNISNRSAHDKKLNKSERCFKFYSISIENIKAFKDVYMRIKVHICSKWLYIEPATLPPMTRPRLRSRS